MEDTTTSVVGLTKMVKTLTTNVDVNQLPEENLGKLTVKTDQTLVQLKEPVDKTTTSVNGNDLLDFEHLQKLMNFIFV